MHIPLWLVDRIASRFRVPTEAVGMFRQANALSGLDRKTLPTELIPLNSVQIARGLLNFTVIQTLEGWVLPYWAERQYDPGSRSFVPRSHLGLSMNVTHRNWTAAGFPGTETEPVIDPRGLATPFRGGWSLDLWVIDGPDVSFPSRLPEIKQDLVEGLPIVRTVFEAGRLRCTSTASTLEGGFTLDILLEHTGSSPANARLALAVRPFNPEGVHPIHSLSVDQSLRRMVVNQREAVTVDATPDAVHCFTFAEGDAALGFLRGDRAPTTCSVDCPAGLASGFFEFRPRLDPGGSVHLSAQCNLEEPLGPTGSPEPIGRGVRAWRSLLEEGADIETPEPEVDAALRGALTTLLLLSDGTTITPGPFTYHHFWIRDSALMLTALDAFGHHAVTRRIVGNLHTCQTGEGYFRSQQGEWDSNGQVLWTYWEHARYSGDLSLIERDYEHLREGVAWIARERRRKPGSAGLRPGLLPAGLSAEHLGLAGQYYWDDLWSIAGIRDFKSMAEHLGRTSDVSWAGEELAGLTRCLSDAVRSDRARLGSDATPAGPGRGFDCGMIGSIAQGYPLHLLPRGDPSLQASVDLIIQRYFHAGLFLQKFIHSGLNPYLTLQVAQCALYNGDRQTFLRILRDVLRRASATQSYPEAIHPVTGGGCMGDGHHGWAAAEVAMALRNMFAMETDGGGTVLLAGIPSKWWDASGGWRVRNLPLQGGRLSLEYSSAAGNGALRVGWIPQGSFHPGPWSLQLPDSSVEVWIDGLAVTPVAGGGGPEFRLSPGSHEVEFRFSEAVRRESGASGG